MFFVTWQVRPGFLERHPVIRLVLLAFGVFVGVGLILDAAGVRFYNPNAEVSTPKPAYSNKGLAQGVYWYLPASLANDPALEGARYLWIPPSLSSSNPQFCQDMDASYYLQPAPQQMTEWNASCSER